MIKNTLSRPIAELKGNDAGQPGSFSFQNVSKMASDMKKFFTVADEELRREQELYFDNVRKSEIKKDIYHKEILLVLIEATTKKKFGEQKMKDNTRKKIMREVKKEEKKAEAPAPKPAEAPKAPAPKPAEAPKPKAEAPKPKAEAPAPKAEAPAPKAETPKPKAEAPPTAKKEVERPKEIPPTARPEVAERIPKVSKLPPKGANKGLVLGALTAAGFSTSAQANILANVDAESGFNPRSEELEKYTASNLYSMYGGEEVKKNSKGQSINEKGNVIRFRSIEEAKAVVEQGPVAVGEVIYGGRMGNDKPGDGYKYRGRGFIQITGKDMYSRVGKMINVDLVNNPDLANDPSIAAKIIPAFFKLKLRERKKSEEVLDDIDSVNQIVGSATKNYEKRKSLASSYKTEINSGATIDAVSSENKDMRKDMTQTPATILLQQNNNVVSQPTTVISPKRPDNTNPVLR